MILGIETSCDETSIALINDQAEVLVNLVSSQIKSHRQYGGVVPELASRLHAERIHGLIDRALKEAQITLSDVTAIGVTQGPGLEGALLVGVSVAKTMGHILNIPVIGINHLKAHIYAHFLTEHPPEFPFLAAVISGGHTQLVQCMSHTEFRLLGQTRDDAAGEAFDKVARLLGLGYPGGPEIEQHAKQGNPHAFEFPIGMRHSDTEFSFSGLKTAVKETIASFSEKDLPVADICASFQYTVAKTLIGKALKTCEKEGLKTVVLCGGVTANRTLLQLFEQEGSQKHVIVKGLDPQLCTDNAAMIAIAAYFHLSKGFPVEPVQVSPNLSL